jgi:hypothetical protein
MALALRAELFRFHREHAAPAVNWASLRGLEDDPPAQSDSQEAGTGAAAPVRRQPSIHQATVERLAADYPLKSTGMSGQSIKEQGARWAVAVREQAAATVRLRMEAVDRARKASAAEAEAAAEARQVAAAPSADTSRQQLAWALQAQQAVAQMAMCENARESRQRKQQLANATQTVGLGRAAMLGGLSASSERADERCS